MTDILQNKVYEYQQWRASLTKAISDYRDWLASSDQADGVQELRLYDILEMLKRDQLVMALLAEFSRGKTETINALFFADFNQRLLPSEPGRTTMCPSEIFWDSREEPSIKLLPIETRAQDDTITYLKTTPNVWHKFRLNLSAPDEMKQNLRKLIDQKEVSKEEAESLGLWNAEDISMVQSLEKTGKVKIPQWRHAIINYPHPLLKSGLVVIDTPGLNTLGAEPELTLNIIPNAHAVLFLTAVDSGITKSDMRIWNEFIKGRAKYKLVLLNKVDMLWDDLKPKQVVTNEIEKQVNITAHQLKVSPESVFAVSAQKALVAKIKKNPALLEQSGLLKLEATLGNQIIQAKHEILGRTVAIECGEMIKKSRKVLQGRLLTLREQLAELKQIRGQSADVSKNILAKVVAERKRYEASIPTFNQANDKITHIGKRLLRHLSLAYLDTTLSKNRQEMGDSWTTVGLNRAMRALMKDATQLAEHAREESKTIKKLAENVYHVFQTRHGFDIFDPPDLDMSGFIDNMNALQKITDDFCTDPINVLTEKHFLIRKFYLGLGAQTQKIFEHAEKVCDDWLHEVLGTLKTQIESHRISLEERSQNLLAAKQSAEALDNQIALVEKEYRLINKQSQDLDAMLLVLLHAVKPAVKAKINEVNHEADDKTLRLPDIPFLNLPSQPTESTNV